jgi:uncharacterized protein (TIGR03085 family)
MAAGYALVAGYARAGAQRAIPPRRRVTYDHRMRYARDERAAICALLDETGPAAPTLCEGWTTLDLAAHLVLREHRPDAGAGMLGGPLAGHTRRVQATITRRNPYPRLVELIRNGPPRFSMFGIPGVDERANVVEFFVHHEDVRRAQPGWEPRETDRGLAEALWLRLKMARLILRKSPVGVEFVRSDEPGPARSGTPSIRMTANGRTPVVTVTGAPAELTLWALGRTAAARVRLDGSEADVSALSAARRHI